MRDRTPLYKFIKFKLILGRPLYNSLGFIVSFIWRIVSVFAAGLLPPSLNQGKRPFAR